MPFVVMLLSACHVAFGLEKGVVSALCSLRAAAPVPRPREGTRPPAPEGDTPSGLPLLPGEWMG